MDFGILDKTAALYLSGNRMPVLLPEDETCMPDTVQRLTGIEMYKHWH